MIIKKRIYFGTKQQSDLNDFEKSSIKDYKERFAKWHMKQIDLLTFCINLNFTISIAIAGFIIGNQENPIFKNGLICDKYSLTKTALCLLALTATIGVAALILRVNDFRLTKNTVKTKRRIFELNNNIQYESSEESTKEILKTKRDNLVFWTNLLGATTWILFYLQITVLLATVWTVVINA